MAKILIKIILLLLLTVFCPDPTFSQDSYTYQGRRYNPYLDRLSLGFGAGFSAYNGELSGFFNPSLQRYYLNPNLGIDFAYRYNDFLSLKGNLNFFLLFSDPIEKYDNENRVFWSVNIDYYLTGVVDILPQRKIDGLFSKWNGAVFGGIGQVVFFPQDNTTGGSKSGEILKENGESGTYDFARLSVIYPIGGIVKYYFDKNRYISLEGTYRYTRTDYLDAFEDVAHPPFDKYFTLQFKYTLIFDSNPVGFFNYKKYMKINKL
jgi:hypothetical protein